MKILFLTDNFPPEVNAPASRTYDHVREWHKAGHEVTVITCAPNFPKWRVYEGYRNKLYQTEWMDGIKVVRVWSYIAANKGFLKRTLDYISYSVTSFLAGLFQKTGRTRQTLWSAVQMLTQKLCCQTIHDCPKVVPLHYESE